MTIGFVLPGYAIKALYISLAAAVLVFVGMLLLTVSTPRPRTGYKSVTTRTSNKTVTLTRPFLLKGVDRTLEAGDYRIVTDEELIEGLSFPVYRRMTTMTFVPGPSYNVSSVEMVTVDPQDLQAAQDRDMNHGA